MRFYHTKLHKGMISGLIITAAIALLLLFLFGCSQKVNTPHRSVDDRLRGVEMPVPSKDPIKKKYKKSFAPLKAYKPNIK
jgi:hypothetical protein